MAFVIIHNPKRAKRTVLKSGLSYWEALVDKRKLSTLYPEDTLQISYEPESPLEIVIHDKGSSILSIYYDFRLHRLRVTFRDGRAITYKDVTTHKYTKLLNASSIGTYYATRIRNKYQTLKTHTKR